MNCGTSTIIIYIPKITYTDQNRCSDEISARLFFASHREIYGIYLSMIFKTREINKKTS